MPHVHGASLPAEELPLARFPFLRTRVLDVALDTFARNHCSVRRAETIASRTPFSWVANRVLIQGVTLLVTRHGGTTRISGISGDSFHLHFARRGVSWMHVGGRSTTVAAGSCATVVSPGLPFRADLGDGYDGAHVLIPRKVVEATLAALVGAADEAPLHFEPGIDLDDCVGGSLADLVDFLIRDADRENGVLAAPLVAAQVMESLQYALLYRLSHSHSGHLRAPSRSAGPAYLRRAEEYLDANAAVPVTTSDLASAIGMSVRSLQMAFRRHRRETPLGFLRERRYQLARRRLLSGTYPTVTSVALDSGFEHLGRFSAGYRERFGESPSETLRRTDSVTAPTT